jgi:ABC-2 type transport system ATP-binding protein
MLFCDLPEALKKRFPGGVIVVHSDDAERVRAELAGVSGERDALLVGDHVHVFVDDAARRLPELRARLDTGRVSYDSIEQVEASIEDIFVSAVERESAKQLPKRPS